MVPFRSVTEGVRVIVRPIWLEAQTDAFAAKFVFSYTVEIVNDTDGEVQLLRRAWRIEHASGHVERVEGEGVVGQQPVLASGGRYEYTSFVVLTTFTGTMEGHYVMERASGERLRVAIPPFHLAAMAN